MTTETLNKAIKLQQRIDEANVILQQLEHSKIEYIKFLNWGVIEAIPRAKIKAVLVTHYQNEIIYCNKKLAEL